MPAKRLSTARVTGIAAWTAASVTWGTAVVAIANASPAPSVVAEGPDPLPEPLVTEAPEAAIEIPAPAMPESGLVVLRYTPSEKPQAQVVVRRVVVSAPSSGGSSSAPAPTKSSPAPASQPPPKTKSGGS